MDYISKHKLLEENRKNVYELGIQKNVLDKSQKALGHFKKVKWS